MGRKVRQVAVERVEPRLLLAAADLDAGFGAGGKTLLDYQANAQDYVTAMALAPGNKIVVGGASTLGSLTKPTLARFNLDGTPDSTFASGGKIQLSTGTGFAELIVNADGSITTLSSSTTGGVALMRRYTSSGGVDGTFSITINPSGTPNDLAERTDGLIYLVVGNNIARINANGSADSTFGSGGVLAIPAEAGPVQFRPQRAAALSDGSVIVGGQYGSTTGSTVKSAAFRHYSAAGVLDASFGTSGTLTLSSLSTNTSVDKLMLLSDGNLLAMVSDFTTSQSWIARFTSGGTLDAGFDTDGLATINESATFPERILDVISDGNNRFLGMAVRVVSNITDLSSFLFRLTNGGAVDTTFANNGYTASYAALNEITYGGPKLLLPGDSWLYHGTSLSSGVHAPPADEILMRFNPDTGAQDTSYAGAPGGRVAWGFRISSLTNTSSSTLMPDGGVAMVGRIPADTTPQMTVARLTESGQPMTSFGPTATGTTAIDFGTTQSVPFDLAAQTDGRIVVVGEIIGGFSPSTTTDYALARLNTDGSLDPTFGSGGEVITSFADQTGEILVKVVIDPTGRIYVAGTRTMTGTTTRIIMRYSSTGQLDANFGSSGRLVTGVSSSDSVQELVALPDGTLLVAGGTTGATSAQDDAFVIHVLENGTIDPSFGTGGKILFDVASSSNTANAMTRDPISGSIYVVSAGTGSPFALQLRRFSSTGQPDPSFGTAGVVTYSGIALLNNVSSPRDLDLTPGGRLLVYATANTSPNDVCFLSFNAGDGSIDAAFGTAGKAVYNLSSGTDADSPAEFHVRPDGHWIAAGTGVGPGEQQNDFAAIRLVGEDTTKPLVSANSFDYQTTQAINLDFSEHINPPLASSLTLQLLPSGPSTPVQQSWLSYAGGSISHRLTVTPNPPLADGNYRLTVPKDSLSDMAGNHMAVDFTFDFFVLAGDANHDRKVDVNDLYLLASNFKQPGVKTFSQGDFNYDGTVDNIDLGVLAARWQMNLAPPPPSLPARLAPPLRRTATRVVDILG